MILTGLGIWTAQFDFHPAKLIFQAVQELEELGYTSLWLGENVGREPISQSALMLDATQTLIVATAVANVWARDPLATLAAQQTISEAHPDRFILGLGVSHPTLVDSLRRLHYTSPLQMMASYLRSLDELLDRYRAVRTSATVRLLGALGPRMLNLSSVMADGAHTYLVPPEHTAEARTILGPGKLLVPEQAVVLETDKGNARTIARQHLRRYLALPNYTRNLQRLGFTDEDFQDNGSDRLVDALIAYGDEKSIYHRIDLHRQAGADHVCIQVLTENRRDLPLDQWRRLAPLS
jgi:probable F420-dependent oxidoreductase